MTVSKVKGLFIVGIALIVIGSLIAFEPDVTSSLASSVSPDDEVTVTAEPEGANNTVYHIINETSSESLTIIREYKTNEVSFDIDMDVFGNDFGKDGWFVGLKKETSPAVVGTLKSVPIPCGENEVCPAVMVWKVGEYYLLNEDKSIRSSLEGAIGNEGNTVEVYGEKVTFDAHGKQNLKGVITSGDKIDYTPLDATAPSPFIFSHWEGLPSSSEVINVEGKEVYAIYEPSSVKGVYDVRGSYLSTNVGPIGAPGVNVSPEIGKYGHHHYEEGAEVTLSPKSSGDYQFKHWIKDGETITTIPWHLTLDSGKNNITAVYEEVGAEYTLSIGEPKGGATVEVENQSYNTPTTLTFSAGKEVTLYMLPMVGGSYEWVRWKGDVSSTKRELTVTMDSDISVTPVFEKVEEKYYFSYSSTSGGEVQANVSEGLVDAGATIEMTAQPDSDYLFDYWEMNGSELSSTKSIEFGFWENVEMTAHFIDNTSQVSLDVSANPTEGGTVSVSEKQVSEGEKIVVEAVPNEGYEFDGWSGDIGFESLKVSLYMDSNREITANFAKEEGGIWRSDSMMIGLLAFILPGTVLVLTSAILKVREN